MIIKISDNDCDRIKNRAIFLVNLKVIKAYYWRTLEHNKNVFKNTGRLSLPNKFLVIYFKLFLLIGCAIYMWSIEMLNSLNNYQ